MKRDILSAGRMMAYQKQIQEERIKKIKELKAMLAQSEKIKMKTFFAMLISWPFPFWFCKFRGLNRDAKEANELIKSMLMVLQG